MLRLARPTLLRRVVALLLIASTGFAIAIPAASQSWPSRPLTMVVPYATGGSTDLVARLIAPGLSAALGQPVLIENMAGVGGIAGVARVAKAAPDGYLSARMPRTSTCLPIRRTMRRRSLCPPLCSPIWLC
jgi:tripartite-type tricarboxylate transporter receptor subunit TctC